MKKDNSYLPAFLEKNKDEFEKYFEMLAEWNDKINLTTIINREDVFIKHFLDSVLPIDFIDSAASVLDIGSGAGFPALPLAIMRKDLNFCLVESVGKKGAFLNEVIRKLAMANCEVWNGRIEDLKNVNDKKFDFVSAKAVARLNVLIEYGMPYLKVGGKLIAYKSSDVDEEIEEAKNALRIMGGEVEKTIEMDLDEQTKRKFIFIKKIQECDKKYPRQGNKPRLKPL